MRFYIDLAPVSSYNTGMKYVSQFYAGFFPPEHDLPRPTGCALNLMQLW